MKNIYNEWVKYKETCYPNGMTRQQELECYQAFIASSLATLKLALTIVNNDKDLSELVNESIELCRKHHEASQTIQD